MLNELAGQDSLTALSRAYRRYTSPAALVIDELGYIVEGNGFAHIDIPPKP